MPLQEGQNDVSLELTDPLGKVASHHFEYHAKMGQTLIHTFSSLESQGLSGRYY
jgi:hypothetical protein